MMLWMEMEAELIKVMGMERPEQGKCYHILTGGNVDLLSHLRWMTHCFGPSPDPSTGEGSE